LAVLHRILPSALAGDRAAASPPPAIPFSRSCMNVQRPSRRIAACCRDTPQDEAKVLMASNKFPHPEEAARRPSRRTHRADPARRESVLCEERGGGGAGGGGGAALARCALALHFRGARGAPGRGAKAFEEAVADFGPQTRLRLRGAPPPPGAARVERRAKP